MNTRDISSGLQSDLNDNGFKSVIVSSEHTVVLKEKIKRDINEGLITDAVYRDYSARFNNMLNENFSWAKSIVVVAAPTPILDVVFTVNNKKHSITIPPTYEHSIDKRVINLIDKHLKTNGYRFCAANLPEKLLAVQSGLARYGKNNIAYVEGMGSFHRPIAFYSDLPPVNDNWQDVKMLDECIGCKACTKKCPTQAIDPDRFQLNAEKCLTFHNESLGEFPSWIDESWHHCLIGCMRCQECCPMNKNVLSWKEHFAEFSKEETALLLQGLPKNELPQSVVSRFETSTLLKNTSNFARNLRSALSTKKM